jgi:hypothetical protein
VRSAFTALGTNAGGGIAAAAFRQVDGLELTPHPVSRPARWAFSPLDYAAHLLLPDGDHPYGVLKARCGHLLPTVASVYDRPCGRKCLTCEVIFLARCEAPGHV